VPRPVRGRKDDGRPGRAVGAHTGSEKAGRCVGFSTASHPASGGKPAREVIEAAKVDGISQRTLERAKPEAQVVACREGFAHGGRWVWRKVDTETLVQQAKAATNA